METNAHWTLCPLGGDRVVCYSFVAALDCWLLDWSPVQPATRQFSTAVALVRDRVHPNLQQFNGCWESAHACVHGLLAWH